MGEMKTSIEEVVSDVKKTATTKKKKKKKLRGNAPSGADLFDVVIGGGLPYGYINFVGDSSSGKCIKNSYILTDNGFEKIDDIGIEFKDGSTEWEKKLIVDKNKLANTSHFYKEKVNHTIEIKTRHGYREEGTPDHKLMVFNNKCEFEMKPLSDIKKNDFLVIERGTNCYGKKNYKIDFKYIKHANATNIKEIKTPKSVDSQLAELMGAFVADGNFSNNTLVFSNNKKWFKEVYPKLVKHCFSTSPGKTGRIHSSIAHDFFFLLFDKPEKFTARYKYIPKCILQSPKEVQASFLKMLIDCDSWTAKKANSVIYSTASKELAHQVSLLLLNMGIVSSCRESKGAWIGDLYYDHIYYDITIGGNDLVLYANTIGSYKYDFTKIKKMEHYEKTCDFDSIPYLLDYMKKDVTTLRKKLNWSRNGRISFKDIKIFPRFLFAGKKNITYSSLFSFIEKFKVFSGLFNIDFYNDLLKKNYHFDKVISTEHKNEETYVYDVCVPDGHLFFANGFINHNSFLSGELISACYHHYSKDEFGWFYDDAERGYSFNSKKLYNLDILNGGFLKPSRRSHTIEDFERNLHEIISKKDPKTPFVYVLDSWDSISSDAELAFREKKRNSRKKKSNEDEEDSNNKKESGTYNLNKQKDTHAFFRTTTSDIIDNNIYLIIISQVKEKIGVSFGRNLYRTGGKALDFYANIVIWLAQAEIYKKKKRPVGFCMKIQGTKTRNENPLRECFIDLLFDYGVDNISSNLKFLYDCKTDRGQDKKTLLGKGGVSFDGKEFMEFNELVQYIEDNNLEDELKNQTIDKWNEIEESISSKHRKRKW